MDEWIIGYSQGTKKQKSTTASGQIEAVATNSGGCPFLASNGLRIFRYVPARSLRDYVSDRSICACVEIMCSLIRMISRNQPKPEKYEIHSAVYHFDSLRLTVFCDVCSI